MYHYAMLRNTGHNYVFYENSTPLALAELGLMPLALEALAETTIAGVSYLTFQRKDPLSPEELACLSRVSSLHALFLKEDDLLRPVALPSCQVYDRSLGTILKYQGKTNELFTRLMLNIAYSLGNIAPPSAVILDPVAGKGTTLFEGFALGSSVYGTELQDKSVAEGYQHMKKFLEKGKHKHKTQNLRVSGPNKLFQGKRYQIHCGEQEWELVSGDTKYCNHLFSKDFFHLIVGDLPYGVQHGNHANGRQRSPAQLLHSALPYWHPCLKKGGVLALSWNTHVLPREQMSSLLAQYGFDVIQNPLLEGLSHTVDASIQRDMVFATKGTPSPHPASK